ncbi:TPA: MAE_28990/MAE_18760 family HEPN-like nuclease [Photobacterium damselae]
MQAFTAEYDKRKSEINSYIDLISILDNDGATLSDIDGNSFPINAVQSKVCKASFYLLLYNLIEATVMNGIISIYDRIKDEHLMFNDIKEDLRRVWWHSKSESIISCPKSEVTDTVYSHFVDAINTSEIEFGRFVSGVSGNLSADGVRKVCHKYGIQPVSDGRDLESIKVNRNNLAHGNKSFSDIGQDLTIPQLTEIKNRVFIFLDQYVANVNSYLDTHSYRHS